MLTPIDSRSPPGDVVELQYGDVGRRRQKPAGILEVTAVVNGRCSTYLRRYDLPYLIGIGIGGDGGSCRLDSTLTFAKSRNNAAATSHHRSVCNNTAVMVSTQSPLRESLQAY